MVITGYAAAATFDGSAVVVNIGGEVAVRRDAAVAAAAREDVAAVRERRLGVGVDAARLLGRARRAQGLRVGHACLPAALRRLLGAALVCRESLQLRRSATRSCIIMCAARMPTSSSGREGRDASTCGAHMELLPWGVQ